MIYKFVPDARIQWRDVAIGAALTSFLFTIGKFCIGLYLGTSGVTSVYGAAGSLITILLWVYYSSLIFFFGAQFTRTYASEYGSGIIPADHVGHNCQLGDHVILANGALLGGYVEVGHHVFISGNCVVHQFVRIGAYALLRGLSGTSRDVPPYAIMFNLGAIAAISA